MRFQVALLAGSRVNFAIRWQSAACLRNSSDGFINSVLLGGQAASLTRRNRPACSQSRSQHSASSRHVFLSFSSTDRSANRKHSLARC
jgi:hypothetical protein